MEISKEAIVFSENRKKHNAILMVNELTAYVKNENAKTRKKKK